MDYKLVVVPAAAPVVVAVAPVVVAAARVVSVNVDIQAEDKVIMEVKPGVLSPQCNTSSAI